MHNVTSKFPDLNVLVVDDYIVNQKLTEAILELLECNVEVVSSGSEAIDLYKKNDFNAIILDILMDDVDGYEVTKQIRKLEKNKHPVKIIALTANASDKDKKKCLKAGMDDYIAKPIKGEEIETVLHKFFPDKAESA